MTRGFVLGAFILLVTQLALADEIEDKVNAISARIGLPPIEDAMIEGTPSSSPYSAVNDPLMPVIEEVNIPAPKPKVSWQPDYRLRDVEYLGQWVDIFVGEGYATPVTFPKPIAFIKIVRGEMLGLTNKFKPGLRHYNFIPRQEDVDTQVIVTAKDGTQYNLLFKDGKHPAAHNLIDAGGVRLLERRDPPKEGINLDDLASWEKYGAGTLSTRERIQRLLVAMYKKEKVSGYTVLNYGGKVVASDPMMQFHLIRVWHKPDARHPIDGIEYWIYNKTDNPISIIPQMLKKALVVDGDFAIHYDRDTILPHDYMPVLVVQRLPEGKKTLEEVPADLNLMLDDVMEQIKAKHKKKRRIKGQLQ